MNERDPLATALELLSKLNENYDPLVAKELKNLIESPGKGPLKILYSKKLYIIMNKNVSELIKKMEEALRTGEGYLTEEEKLKITKSMSLDAQLKEDYLGRYAHLIRITPSSEKPTEIAYDTI
ncbi:MAG: hypothetical protein ABIH72_05635 [archaeon]